MKKQIEPEQSKHEYFQAEQYLIVLNDIPTGDVFTVLAPTRKDYKEMIGLLPNRLYVRAVQVVESSVDFKEMMIDLRNQRKPKDLQTGKGE